MSGVLIVPFMHGGRLCVDAMITAKVKKETGGAAPLDSLGQREKRFALEKKYEKENRAQEKQEERKEKAEARRVKAWDAKHPKK